MPIAAQAVTQASITIGSPRIGATDLTPDDDVAAGYVPGGPVSDTFLHLLGPAPVGSFTDGAARIMRDAPGAIAGRSIGDSRFLIVADRYAPSFTFTAAPGSRITVETDYRLKAGVHGERFDADDPARAYASLELSLLALRPLGGDDFDVLASNSASDLLATPTDRSFAGQLQRNGVLSLSFDNPGNDPAVFAFRAEMVAFGASKLLCRKPTSHASFGWLLLGLTGVAGTRAASTRGKK